MKYAFVMTLLTLILSGCCAAKKNVSKSRIETNAVIVGEQNTDVQMLKTDSSNTDIIEIAYTETIVGDSSCTPTTTRKWSVKKESRNSLAKMDSSTVASLRSEFSEQVAEQTEQIDRTQNTAPMWLLLVASLLVIAFMLYISWRR